MTTTATTVPPAIEAHKKGHSIMDAMKRGRELATVMVLVLTFLHSMYASYFKKEKVAEAGYKQTSETIEDYSRVVHDEVEALKTRLSTLEDELAEVKAAKAEADAQLLKSRPRHHIHPVVPVVPAPVVTVEGVRVESHAILVAMPDAPDVDTDGVDDASDVDPDDLDPLIVKMPERPWEQQQKK